jgi:hypothetical protein
MSLHRKHRHSRQRGEFLLSRAVVLVVVLLAILAVALWLAKGRDNKRLAAQKVAARSVRPMRQQLRPPHQRLSRAALGLA